MFEVLDTGIETGKAVSATATYVQHRPDYGILDGYCILGFKMNYPAAELRGIKYKEGLYAHYYKSQQAAGN